MATCSFFFLQQVNKNINLKLYEALLFLIENKNIDLFYLTDSFPIESDIKKELRFLRKQYSYIGYSTVLSEPPKPALEHFDYTDTICLPCYSFPAYAEKNLAFWLINRSDCIVTYMPHKNGSAAYFKRFLEKKGKQLINLADFCE